MPRVIISRVIMSRVIMSGVIKKVTTESLFMKTQLLYPFGQSLYWISAIARTSHCMCVRERERERECVCDWRE